MSPPRKREATGLAAMPGVMVPVTLLVLFALHAGGLYRDRDEVDWSGEGLERFYREASASELRGPVGRQRATFGLGANDVVMRGDELFYLPDIEHLAGPDFLAEHDDRSHVVLEREVRREREEDPLGAILEFDRELRERGVRLVLMPTPSKAMLAGPEARPMRNAGFEAFVAQVGKHGIPVFDPAPALADFEARGKRAFLRTDSHWTPEAMRLCAVLLALFLEREGWRPAQPPEQLLGTTRTITGSGDLALLLEDAPSGRWRETVEVHPIHREDGSPWNPEPSSPVLLLGDSFTNVFSLAGMGWGEGAGFAEALSQVLGLSVDRIARNADGAFASREALRQEAGRLKGKSVVVWQFAARELSFGDWRVLPLTEASRTKREGLGKGATTLRGTVVQVAPVPELSRTPYRQAVMEVLLTDVAGPGREAPHEVVLLGLGVDDREPTAMTTWKAGREVSVTVLPWREVEERYGRLHRFALEDPELRLLETPRFWMK